MRLTLRTLLSYLDDQLDAAAAKEIGQKLAETPAAQQLVSRIREVTRRRRLTAPPLAGDDVDPNTMAEYLDNLLPAEVVAQVEGLCLESDVHLAEAAAAHQILTLIGQPANVSDSARRRMYELVHAIESLPADKRQVPHAVSGDGAGPRVFSARPLSARIWTAAAVVLGAIGTALLVWVTLNVGESRREPIVASGEPEAAGRFLPQTVRPEDSELELPELPAMEPAAPRAESSAAPVTTPADSPPPDSSPVTEPVEAKPAVPDRTEPQPTGEPAETKPAGAAQPRPGTSPEPAPEPAVPPAAAAPAAPVLGSYVSTTGVLLHRNPSARDWRRVATKADIKAEESILSLPWFRSDVQIAGDVSLELVGETELELAPPGEGIDVHVKLERGRVVLSANKARGTFQIDFHGQSWRISIPGPELLVGLKLGANWRPGGPFVHEAILVVPRGEVELVAGDQPIVLGGPVQLRWDSQSGLSEKESLSGVPAWMDKEERTLLEARAAGFIESSLPTQSSVVRPLIDATTDKSRETRLLAVQCLLAIGRLPALIDAMNSGPGARDVRQAAIHALRQYMARGKEQEQQLLEALFLKFNQSQDDAAGVLGLLRGYSDAEFNEKRPEDYENLIDLLSEDRAISIRELAIMNLEELAGKPASANYSPDRPRDSDIAGWRRALKDGQLPPKVRGKM